MNKGEIALIGGGVYWGLDARAYKKFETKFWTLFLSQTNFLSTLIETPFPYTCNESVINELLDAYMAQLIVGTSNG